MNSKKWLNEKISSDYEHFEDLLTNYFNKVNDESKNKGGDILDSLTVYKLKNLIISRLLLKDNGRIYLTYRELFSLISEVYVLPSSSNEVELSTEIYNMVIDLYKQENNIHPLIG